MAVAHALLNGTEAAGLAARLVAEIRQVTGGEPIVVAFSGGLDSTTVAALAKEALGASNVLLVTVNMGAYAYRRGNEIVLEMAEQLGLPQRCLLGQFAQHHVQRNGPACNRCAREIKLGMVRRVSRGRLVLTVCNGYYAPLLDLEKPQIRAIAAHFGLRIPKIGENPGREGCKLKHLLKPLINPNYHGRAVAEANEIVLRVLRQAGVTPELANVKIIGPLGRNIGLVNVKPPPDPDLKVALLEALRALPVLDEVHIVETPLRLVVKAGPGVMNDPHARHWLQHGRMQPDFAFPIEVQWTPARHNRLHTFQVVGFDYLTPSS